MHHATARTLQIARACIAAIAMQAGVAAHAGDPAALRTVSLAATCAACHGTEGHAVPRSPVPGLAGTPADQLREAMLAFRSDRRAGTVMPQLAKGYSDQQIDTLAAFFASQAGAR